MRKKIVITLSIWLIAFFSSSTLANIYGPTQASDRLWQIAIKVRPSEGITLQQMLVALWKRNPAAFKENNINGLYSGVRLSVPSPAEIQSVDPLQAADTVEQQNRRWYRDSSTEKLLQPQIAIKQKPLPTDLNLKFLTIQNAVTSLASDLEQYMINSHDRVELVAEKQVIMQKQLISMARQIESLTDQLDVEKSALLAINNHNASQRSSFENKLKSYEIAAIALVGSMLFLLVFSWMKFLRQRKMSYPIIRMQQQPKNTKNQEANDDLEDEYDFINSAEGIPAKLDLARAYIDMDDHESAKTMLEDIIKHGDQEQKQAAQHLLSHITLPQTS